MTIHLNLKLNRKHLLIILIVTAMIVGTLFANSRQDARAATFGSTEDAIAIAAAHPAFVPVLAANPDYTVAAYDTGLSYGIWRVQFWDGDGEEIGWADVSVAKSRVYSYECTWGLTEDQRWTRKDQLIDVVAADPDVRELVGDPHDRDIWIDYNGWTKMWYLYIEAGIDSIYVGVKVDSVNPLDFENPRVDMIYFAKVKAYSEWEQDQQARAIAIAFANTEVAAALRDHDGWTTETERTGDATWLVKFKVDDTVLAEVSVDLATGEIVEMQIQ
ncbi:MAG: hypothetical protein KF726_19335 [Anaerolineae bacterium]|nr:hypothetical protein [Anaerolineae bacterium]